MLIICNNFHINALGTQVYNLKVAKTEIKWKMNTDE